VAAHAQLHSAATKARLPAVGKDSSTAHAPSVAYTLHVLPELCTRPCKGVAEGLHLRQAAAAGGGLGCIGGCTDGRANAPEVLAFLL